ncbi:hypothetical protein E2C01_017716 [Portunus trituberculatus]|uniref:Uncharacterized protein n=1 Tax=Portunus trituberculatus TaxID=210409 RepID=A0A5B7DT98_PORTR|nr:hypothetical protein [Portunus trituberculatus]
MCLPYPKPRDTWHTHIYPSTTPRIAVTSCGTVYDFLFSGVNVVTTWGKSLNRYLAQCFS